jgi:hypothetical protein
MKRLLHQPLLPRVQAIRRAQQLRLRLGLINPEPLLPRLLMRVVLRQLHLVAQLGRRVVRSVHLWINIVHRFTLGFAMLHRRS